MARMRRIAELGVAATVSIFLLMFLASRTGHLDYTFLKLGQHTKDLTGQYPYVKPSPLPWHPPSPTYLNSSSPTTGPAPDRIIVLTTLKNEDTHWLAKELPGWNSSIFVLDSNFAKLHEGSVRVDKGRIAAAYLHYIIENYHALPKTMVFLNPYQNGQPPNTNHPGLGRVQALETLNIQHVQKEGFANLRCMGNAGCINEMLPFRDPPDEFRTLEVAMPKAWEDLFKNTDVPEKLASPCCAEFAVSRDQVKKRGVEEYLKYWSWLHETKMDDDTAGYVFEYIWHIIFGKSAVYCPELGKCECDVYGKC
ncbi:hypothetical protein P154DRAFT_522186 [Amniculicola lignicola CBS 123094]|uniref:Uncharacterized protein n=1 Tax=Amniculicola lignicola CBS 123094 TaxID=1392246 RepID=A0A6A5WJ09_9PLEO|nr:hypothetical protein P154DRAFT_522186 [Amniculicola lignicola CBS 123094]